MLLSGRLVKVILGLKQFFITQIWRYLMMQCDRPWFENIRINHQNSFSWSLAKRVLDGTSKFGVSLNLIAQNRKNVVMYRETLLIRKTCLSETSCFEIIISHSWEYYFPKLLYWICLLWIYKCHTLGNFITLGNSYLLYKMLLWYIILSEIYLSRVK